MVVDTCVILDVLEQDPAFGLASAEVLEKHAEGGLVIYHRRVYAAEAAADPVALAERETVCRSAWARLTPCLEHDFENAVCRLCGKPGANLYFDPMDADEPYKNQEVITLYDGRLDLGMCLREAGDVPQCFDDDEDEELYGDMPLML